MPVVNVNFTSVAIGCLIFMLCLSGAMIIGAPMFGELKAEAQAKQVGAVFSESESGLTAMSRVEGYEDNQSQDVTTYVVDNLESIQSRPNKGQFLGGAIRMGGMVFGVLTRLMFFTDVFPKGVMPEPSPRLYGRGPIEADSRSLHDR